MLGKENRHVDQPVIFDTLAYVKKLTDAGVGQSAAEAIAHGQVEFLSQNVAATVDIERSKNDLMKWLVLTMILLESLLLAAIKLL